MSKIFFIGDTHFGHNNISEKFRTQFSSDAEHDETIFQNIMECSGKRNILYLMGDIIFKQEHVGKLYRMIESFHHIYYCLGNHDTPSISSIKYDNLHFFGLRKKYDYWLSHAPIHEAELRGKLCIHGHVHNATLPDPRYFNVSCENIGYKPISLQEINSIMKRTTEGD